MPKGVGHSNPTEYLWDLRTQFSSVLLQTRASEVPRYVTPATRPRGSAFGIFPLRHRRYLCAFQSLPVCFKTKQMLFAKCVHSKQFSELFTLRASPVPGKCVYLHVETICAPHLHKSPIRSLWPSSSVMSEDSDGVFMSLFPLLLTDSNNHDGKKPKKAPLFNTGPCSKQSLEFPAAATPCQALGTPCSSPIMSISVRGGNTVLFRQEKSEAEKQSLALSHHFKSVVQTVANARRFPVPCFSHEANPIFAAQ